ncbi:MAG: transcription termination/antitermination NusG family protein [Acidobacteriota bacterium]
MPILDLEVDLLPQDLFELPIEQHPWWVAYVRSRQEKVLARHLQRAEVAFYLPLECKRVAAVGPRAVAQVPLFGGYVFFRGQVEARREALKSNVIVSVLAVPDQVLLHQELATLRALQVAGARLVPLPEVVPGDLVRVTAGPLAGAMGTVLREKGGGRFVATVTFLRRTIAAEFDREMLVPVSVSACA